jgi:hypothetical protein
MKPTRIDYLLTTWIQNFAATMGIALPAHREKESILPDLRNSPHQSTQPTSNTAIVAPSINKTVSLFSQPHGQDRKADLGYRCLTGCTISIGQRKERRNAPNQRNAELT